MYVVSCWIEYSTYQINQTFYYETPIFLKRGVRVTVPFGRQNVVGFVHACQPIEEAHTTHQLKKVLEVLDEEPILTSELYDLGLWMAQTTISPVIACFQAMLPKKVKPKRNQEKILYVKYVRIKNFQPERLTEKQHDVYDYVLNNQSVVLADVKKQYGSSVLTLIKNNILEVYEDLKSNSIKLDGYETKKVFPLTPNQQSALDALSNTEKTISLLYGVTGSGKTEIYLHYAQNVIDAGKQVLFLVPEISLTPQMIAHVKSRFNEKIAIFHSALSHQEKFEEYQKVLQNKVSIVVGTRSSVFLPFQNLGLVIMDEEHDLSYKQEHVPFYHARDVVIKRAITFQAKVVLGSATPSLESFARAKKGSYQLVTLKERINQQMPSITLVDMSRQLKRAIVSNVLYEKIAERLSTKQQVIILLNRRGFATRVTCQNCGRSIQCDHCDVLMHYHKDQNILKCHMCSAIKEMPHTCPYCNQVTMFTQSGFGTQTLQEVLKKNFPSARILRMDADTTTKKNAHQTMLKAFGDKEYDILVGTQMIAKGLDFPNVTLVGIVNADAPFNRPDYRAQELVFDLLTQAAGRSGRSHLKGEVIIQAQSLQHYVMDAVVSQQYELFYKNEMQYRQLGFYPPYSHLIVIVLKHPQMALLQKEVSRLHTQLSGEFEVLGPSELYKVANYYRYRFILKGTSLAVMNAVITQAIDQLHLKVSVSVNVSPMTIE